MEGVKSLRRGYRVGARGRRWAAAGFITGFLDHGVVRTPCDIFKLDDHSFLLSDDVADVIYHVRANK